MNEQNENFCLFLLVFPEIGHINPVNGIVKELIQSKGCEVIFYGRHWQKNLIQSTGSTFREYKFYLDDNAKSKSLKEDIYTNDITLFTNLISLSYKEIPCLLNDIQNDNPDLIIFDQLSMPAKYLLKIMQENFKSQKSSFLVPSVQIFTTFPFQDCIFSDKKDYKKFIIQQNGIYFKFRKYLLLVKQRNFSKYFGIDCSDPFDLYENFQSELNIVTFIPEIQPFNNLVDSSFKYVGNCVVENFQKEFLFDTRLNEILNLIEPINPNYQNKKIDIKLIYVSLGTVFNNNIFIFDCAIETIKNLNIINKNLITVMAVGDENLRIYEERIKNGYIIPDNVLILSFAPQIELLKRARVFVTHCGMNSSSEAIHYGVPMVGIPIKADQPIVAHRICNELNIGIYLNALETTSDTLLKAIMEILNDVSFSVKIKELSKISRNYNASSKAAELIFEFTKSNKK